MTTTAVNYLARDTEPSLHRNGKIFTIRDGRGNDNNTQGLTIEPVDVHLRDARSGAHGPGVSDHGFEVVSGDRPSAEMDFLDHECVRSLHYPYCEALIADTVDATAVVAFDYNVRTSRSETRQRVNGGQDVQGPARVVHSDYTLDAGPARLAEWTTNPDPIFDSQRRDRLDPDVARDAQSGGRRYSIINVWTNRSAVPVQRDPMALCAAGSIDLDDLSVFEIHYPERIGENYFARHRAAHEWWWAPELRDDEALLIKQWDSGGGLADSGGRVSDAQSGLPSTFSFHTAVEVGSEDAPPRESIEVRCFVFY